MGRVFCPNNLPFISVVVGEKDGQKNVDAPKCDQKMFFFYFPKDKKKDTHNREVEIVHTFITFFSPAPERARSGDFANSAECKQKHENEECN